MKGEEKKDDPNLRWKERKNISWNRGRNEGRGGRRKRETERNEEENEKGWRTMKRRITQA